MKKLMLFVSVFSLILCMTAFSVSAAPKSLLPSDVSKWKPVEAGGETATAVIKNGATVVSGSVQSWPNVSYSMGANERITVPIKGYAIEYDIVVDKGQANIFLYMKGDTPEVNQNNKMFKFMDCIVTQNKEAGSGDVKAGTYKGVITLEKLMSTATFPADSANSDNTITFSGISIYSVIGATVTVNKFQLIEATESSASSAASSAASSSAASSAASSNQSKASSVSAASSAQSSPAASSKAASSAPSSSENEPASTWYYIIGGAAIVAVIVLTAVIIIRKKK